MPVGVLISLQSILSLHTGHFINFSLGVGKFELIGCASTLTLGTTSVISTTGPGKYQLETTVGRINIFIRLILAQYTASPNLAAPANVICVVRAKPTLARLNGTLLTKLDTSEPAWAAVFKTAGFAKASAAAF